MPTVILTAILRECQNSDLHTPAYPAYRSLRVAIRISRCLEHGEADLAVTVFQTRLPRHRSSLRRSRLPSSRPGITMKSASPLPALFGGLQSFVATCPA